MSIMLIMVLAFLNAPRTDPQDITNFKFVDSILIQMKNNGTLNEIVHTMETGNQGKINKKMLNALKDVNTKQGLQLQVNAYAGNMTLLYSDNKKFRGTQKRAYATSTMFKTNSSTAPYGLAVLIIGRGK